VRILYRLVCALRKTVRNIFLKLRYGKRIVFGSWRLWQYSIKRGFRLVPMYDLETGSRKLTLFLERHVRIEDDVMIKGSAEVRIAERVLIGSRCVIGSNSGIIIGANCLLAENISIRDSDHVFHSRETPIMLQGVSSLPVTINDDVWIGYGAVITKGVTLEKGCVIGANAVVTRSMPEYSVCAGSPARIINTRGNGPDR
jgi:acetyltransferase-like isoleucine patch superfamily enzyme